MSEKIYCQKCEAYYVFGRSDCNEKPCPVKMAITPLTVGDLIEIVDIIETTPILKKNPIKIIKEWIRKKFDN